MDGVLPKRRDVMVRPMGGERMVRDTPNEMVHFLNPTAAVIWDCLDGATTVTECECRIRDAFEVPAEVDVAGDIRTQVQYFREQGLLEE